MYPLVSKRLSICTHSSFSILNLFCSHFVKQPNISSNIQWILQAKMQNFDHINAIQSVKRRGLNHMNNASFLATPVQLEKCYGKGYHMVSLKFIILSSPPPLLRNIPISLRYAPSKASLCPLHNSSHRIHQTTDNPPQ